MTLTIATRGSKLALWQADHVVRALEAAHPGLSVRKLVLKTQGDKILDVPLAQVGGKGLFVKEIEEALLDGRADLAVHSMKDVPAEQPEGLVLGPVPEREDPADVLLSREFDTLTALPPGAVVGTSSLRRQAQLLALRPDLAITTLRGNLDTRLGKLLAGDFAAIVVASAGLNRLGLTAPYLCRLAPPDFLPAVGQGALCLEYRADDRRVRELCAFLDHPDTRDAVAAERAFLARLEGGCQVPIAGHARLAGPDTLEFAGLVADVSGRCVIRETRRAPRSQTERLGREAAEAVLARGAAAILAEAYALDPTRSPAR